MKRILLLILLCLSTLRGFSQVTSKLVNTETETEVQTLAGGRYTFNQSADFKDTAPAGSNYIYTFKIIKSTTVIIYDSDDDYIYFKKDPESFNQTFAVKRKDFFYYTTQQFKQFKGAEVGVYTIPFRIRGGGDDLDFETNLSLQANIVFGFGKKTSQNSWFDASAGIGLSSISLNSKNSKVTENRTASALTLSIGGVVKPTSRANIGLFLGGDFLGRSDKDVDWKYDRNLWLGVGVNISFNKVSTDEPANSTSNAVEKDLKNILTKFKAEAEKELEKNGITAAETIKAQADVDFIDSELKRIEK